MTTKILMVDDEPDAEELFRQNFRREIRKGVYNFIFAQSGQEALDALADEDGSSLLLLLSDINMPGMTGLELLDEVRQQYSNLPIYMVTAYGDDETRKIAETKGAQDLLSKPVDFVHLKQRLNELVENLGA